MENKWNMLSVFTDTSNINILGLAGYVNSRCDGCDLQEVKSKSAECQKSSMKTDAGRVAEAWEALCCVPGKVIVR